MEVYIQKNLDASEPNGWQGKIKQIDNQKVNVSKLEFTDNGGTIAEKNWFSEGKAEDGSVTTLQPFLTDFLLGDEPVEGHIYKVILLMRKMESHMRIRLKLTNISEYFRSRLQKKTGCPLSALFPLLAPDNKGAVMSILNLAAGLSTFLAAAIAGLFFKSLGAGGVLFIYAGFYLLSAILTPFLKTPEELLSKKTTESPQKTWAK